MAKNIIAVVGTAGSGKTEATKIFLQYNFYKIYFGQYVLDELARRGLAVNEKNERKVREDLRNEYGQAAMAILSLPQIEKAASRFSNIVIESLYSWAEYKILKEKFPQEFKVLAIYAPPPVRYQRLSKRPKRPLSEAESQSRDYSQIENVAQGGPIAMADFLIMNVGTLEEFKQNVAGLIQKIA